MTKHLKISIGVGGLVFRDHKRKEVLLVRHTSTPSVWTIPSGFMTDDENIFQTISRELKEETNIRIVPKEIIAIRQKNLNREENNIWIIVQAKFLSGKVIPDNKEVVEAGFKTIKEALTLPLTPITKQLLKLSSRKKLNTFTSQNKFNKKGYKFFA